MRALWLLTLFAAVSMVVGCGGSDKPYQIPVDSPAKPFTPPEAEDLSGEQDDADDWSLDEDEDEAADADADADEGDGEGAAEDEGEGEAGGSGAAPAGSSPAAL